MTDLDELLSIANGAVDIAHHLIQTRAPGIITAKGDRDMASELDYEVERSVREFLRQRTPDIAFIGEEEGATGKISDLTWALDPVDGTANLLHGLPLCATSLGLLSGDHAIVGVIDLPMLGLRYTAAEDLGAFENDRPIRVSETASLHDAAIAIGDYAIGPAADERNERRLAVTRRLAAQAQRVRMLGSATIDLAWVAAGKLDGALMLSNTAWDTTAGAVLVREAGGHVLDEDGSEHSPNSRATVAMSPALRRELLAAIATSA